MQELTGGPRAHLTEQQVRTVLSWPTPAHRGGLELIDPVTLKPTADLSHLLVDGTCTRDLDATVHGSCNLELRTALRWGVDLVRPYTVMRAGELEARFHQGVYLLTIPKRTVGTGEAAYSATGFDRLHLLEKLVDRTYTVPSDTFVLQAVAQAFTDAGVSGVRIDSTAASAKLPAGKVWPLIARPGNPEDQGTSPATWLRVINDLLQQVNYRAAYCDEDGYYRCEPYRNPRDRPTEWEFTDVRPADVPLAELRDVIEQVHGMPNRWTVIASNPPDGVFPTEANGLVQRRDDLEDQAARGIWPARYEFEAADAASLAALADRQVIADRSLATTIELATAPFPLARHADTFAYVDREAGLDAKVQAVQSTVDLLGADTAWKWETV